MINRRGFIEKSAIALAASMLPYHKLIAPFSSKKLGVALVGLGSYSTHQLTPALQQTEHIELRGIVTGSPEKVPQWKKKYGIKDANIYNYDTMHKVASNPDIDVIYIVTPTFLHAKYAIIAANAGKHVFCEKPMAMNVKECRSIINACEQNKVRLAIGYRMQHEKNTQKIMAWSQTKPYGEIEKVKSSVGFRIGNEGAWRLDGSKGGGAIYDMGVYPINALRYASGLEPLSVTARHDNKRPELFINGANEITYFDFDFPDGIKGDGFVTYASGINTLGVTCAEGSYSLSPFQSYQGVSGTTSDGKQLEACDCNQQAIQMDDDALSIIEGREMKVPGEEGLKDIRIVEAILESAKNGSKKVMI
ncbi:Gfo/Idh/MocA family protein [Sediminibacter sp. Hel_I_10]|uniref:Gfo/Idh/MocA family protein n=1 Tax=Sediminibacter sp. Hel_I_10 TaxID=1392490 RepID=UPI00047BC6BC|nr:Gfo/Idh/MocA family oxidoreductase [Sediminibacter sp. Hel_I_10]